MRPSGHDFKREVRQQHETNRPISKHEIETAIRRLGSHKALGPDGVHLMFLKEGGAAVVESLQFIFNASLKTGKLPRIKEKAEAAKMLWSSLWKMRLHLS